MLTVIDQASSYDLATLGVVKAALGVTGSDEDAALSALISRASAAITVACNRTLVEETVEQSFWDGGARILLARYPVTSIVSSTEQGVLLDPSLYDIDGEAGILYRQREGGRCWAWALGRTVVRYTAGYPVDAIPPDLVQATIMLVQQYRSQGSRDPLLRSETTTDVETLEYFPTTAAGLPAPVVALIEPYRKLAGC